MVTDKGELRSQGIFPKDANLSDEERKCAVQEQQRIVECCNAMNTLAFARSSANLLVYIEGLLAEYERLKSARALMDYDDIIVRAGRLLADAGAAWVMYKLDEGIDHLLVDEAQDTSREQWRIAEALTQEYFSGEGVERGAERQERTLFVVGDEKQSIFSFQGAYPAGFIRWKEIFGERVQAAGCEWFPATLPQSRRSVQPVLGLVDAVFHDSSLIGDAAGEVRHVLHREGEGGTVEVWPLLAPASKEEAGKDARWQIRREREEGEENWRTLAAMIADTLEQWWHEGETLAATGSPIRPGDVLILVQRRNAFVPMMVRALQQRGIPVAGADRLKLGESLVVKDLLGFAAFALLPEDDLNLACILKSPLFNIDEEKLCTLAALREGKETLWQRLLAYQGRDSAYAHACTLLMALLERADYVRPYLFFTAILEEFGGRERILGRMGSSQLDVIEEFLNAVLVFEQAHPPTLQHFYHWMQMDEAEIKRDLQQGADEVRIMTVHGAKGLEAPVVFLPDTVHVPQMRSDRKDRIAWREGGEGALAGQALPFVLPAKQDDCLLSRALKDEEKRQQMQEHYRLLYVALTRARDRLYVCGVQGQKKPSSDCWYQKITEARERLPQVEKVQTPPGGGWRLEAPQNKSVSPIAPACAAQEEATAFAMPAPLPPEEEGRVLSPSRLWEEEEPAAPSPQGKGNIYQRGTLIHRLLQYLPAVEAQERPALAQALLARYPELEGKHRAEMILETLRLLSDPAFALLFTPHSRAEVPVVGTVEMDGKRKVIAGQVDRLAVTGNEVWIIDYKTNAEPPQTAGKTPIAYLRQMAAYRALLQQIYPQKTVRCALLWTAAPVLMELESMLLDRFLKA